MGRSSGQRLVGQAALKAQGAQTGSARRQWPDPENDPPKTAALGPWRGVAQKRTNLFYCIAASWAIAGAGAIAADWVTALRWAITSGGILCSFCISVVRFEVTQSSVRAQDPVHKPEERTRVNPGRQGNHPLVGSIGRNSPEKLARRHSSVKLYQQAR